MQFRPPRSPAHILSPALLIILVLGPSACSVDNSFDPVPPTGKFEIYGDLEIDTQLEMDNLKGIRRIVGDLQIYAHDMWTLAGLVDLIEVTGELHIRRGHAIPDVAPLAGLQKLGSLKIYDCERIKTLDPLRNVEGVTSVSVTYCDSLTTMLSGGSLGVVEDLTLRDLPQLASLDFVDDLDAVTHLELEELPAGLDYSRLSNLTSLVDLELGELPITALPDLSRSTLLDELRLYGLPALESFAGIAYPHLRTLYIRDCPLPATLADMGSCPELLWVEVQDCDGLTELGVPGELADHAFLDLSECDSLVDLQGLSAEWHSVTIWSCASLVDLTGVPEGSALTRIRLGYLPQLHSLAGLPAGLVFDSFTAFSCPEFHMLDGLTLAADANLELNSLPRLVDLTGMTVPSSLWRLEIDGTGITDLAVFGPLTLVYDLTLNNSPLVDLSGLENLRTINGPMCCRDNLYLADAAALGNVVEVGGWRVCFRDNPLLDSCAVASMVAGWDVAGAIEIEDNGPCAD
ncbi:MAG: hypothetical protein GY838_02600 [bacterium]|nr:hypothetical protein [bacterium]